MYHMNAYLFEVISTGRNVWTIYCSIKRIEAGLKAMVFKDFLIQV